jgi:oxalate---CoA ligase
MQILLDHLGSITVGVDGETWSGERLSGEIKKRSAKLTAMGVSRGDRVLVLHGGSHEFFADLLALWNVGACAACLNPALTPPEVETVALFLKPQAALVADKEHDISIPDVTVVDLGGEEEAAAVTEMQPDSAGGIDDEALILFTSGTTGVPKGVVHTFRSLWSRIALNQAEISLQDLRVTLSPLPTHFGHGLIGNCLSPLLAGQDLILVSGSDLRVAAKLGEIIDRYQVTFMSSVPAMWKLVTKASKPPVQGSLRRIHIGSAPLSADLWQQVMAWSGVKNVVNMYGITETANWVGGASAAELVPEDGLIGRAWGGDIAVRTDGGEILAQGEGELVVQSPSLMAGYHQRPELNEKVLVNGWFYTGDVGAIDHNGVVRLTGRKKFEINRAGLKVHPEDIDILLERHPMVYEACAFAVPDPIAGESVGVAVSAVEGGEIELDVLQGWCRENLVKEKVPEKWFVLSVIPKTDRGKMNRDIVARACLG